jgi:hypothetical protein
LTPVFAGYIGQELGVVGGIVQHRDIAVGRIADHESDPLVGERWRAGDAGEQREQRQQKRESTRSITFRERVATTINAKFRLEVSTKSRAPPPARVRSYCVLASSVCRQ